MALHQPQVSFSPGWAPRRGPQTPVTKPPTQETPHLPDGQSMIFAGEKWALEKRPPHYDLACSSPLNPTNPNPDRPKTAPRADKRPQDRQHDRRARADQPGSGGGRLAPVLGVALTPTLCRIQHAGALGAFRTRGGIRGSWAWRLFRCGF